MIFALYSAYYLIFNFFMRKVTLGLVVLNTMVLTFITFRFIIIIQVDTASYILEQFIDY